MLLGMPPSKQTLPTPPLPGWDDSQAARELFATFLGPGSRFQSYAASKQSVLALVSAGFGITLAAASQPRHSILAWCSNQSTNPMPPSRLRWHGYRSGKTRRSAASSPFCATRRAEWLAPPRHREIRIQKGFAGSFGLWIKRWPPELSEHAIGRHEPLEHRRDELRGFNSPLPRLTGQNLAIGDEVAVDHSRQLDGDPDRLVVLDGAELQLGHAGPVLIATEGALWGSVKAHGLLTDTVIISDDAGQFQVGRHGLCWVPAERLVHKLDTFTDQHRAAQQRVRSLIWWFYADLKTYRHDPTPARKAALRARFDRIFKRRTGFATLDRLLARLHANKTKLLMVLDRPEIPFHTNGSQNDIRCQVTKRKVSGGTRSDAGRDCRDAFLGLAKTCIKLGISFWDYLGARLAVAGSRAIPRLSELVANQT